MKEKIAIQGIEGSFHHQVARDYFGRNAKLKKCVSFAEVAEKVNSSEAAVGIMAIENSIAGSILPNYRLIEQYGLQIVGEHYLQVDMNLMALPGTKMQDVQKVYSHPVALRQCEAFFRKNPQIELIEFSDTASAAKMISEEELKNAAAVAGKTAAGMFGLEILADNIQREKCSTTRFFVLKSQREQVNIPEADKATLKLLRNGKSEEASLARLEQFGLQIVGLQKRDFLTTFVDVLFDSSEALRQALEAMPQELKLLGIYRKKLEHSYGEAVAAKAV